MIGLNLKLGEQEIFILCCQKETNTQEWGIQYHLNMQICHKEANGRWVRWQP